MEAFGILFKMLGEGGWSTAIAAVVIAAYLTIQVLKVRKELAAERVDKEAERAEKEALAKAADGVDWILERLVEVQERKDRGETGELTIAPRTETLENDVSTLRAKLEAAERRGLEELGRHTKEEPEAIYRSASLRPSVMGVKVPPKS